MTAATLPLRRITFPAISLPRPNLWRDALLVLGATIGLAQALGILHSVDAVIYYRADLDALYPIAYTSGDPAYVYPPPMAQAIAPLHAFGYGLFQIGLTTALFGAVWFCAGRWAWGFVAAGIAGLFLPVPAEATQVFNYATLGNVQLLLAAAIAASFRHGGAWALPLLTKPTMGIGVLWHAFRGEWRQAGVAIGITATIAAASAGIAPHLWIEFVEFSLRNGEMRSAIPLVPVSLPIRLAMSAALLAWAAPRGHRWAVPIAAGWAIPLLYSGSFVAIWIAAIRLRGDR